MNNITPDVFLTELTNSIDPWMIVVAMILLGVAFLNVFVTNPSVNFYLRAPFLVAVMFSFPVMVVATGHPALVLATPLYWLLFSFSMSHRMNQVPVDQWHQTTRDVFGRGDD